MAQAHGDRLSAVDASFLAQEGDASHMHIGALMILEGPPPSYDDFAAHIRSRLHLVPRYRHKLAVPPLETGRPLWVDDPAFNLSYHVRHTALPAPGRPDQLRALAARIFSQQLDRAKPLWEMWLVEGLHGAEGGGGEADRSRFALISKTHHALVDGVSGVDLATVIFDLIPEPDAATGHPEAAWIPHREPSALELAAKGVRALVRTPFELTARAAEAASHPGQALAVAREAAEGVGELVWAGLNPAPQTPLNVPIGPHRRLELVRCELADFKAVKNAFGGTVNDVVLTVVAGALRRWLRLRGVRTEGLELRALVPVSVRTQHDQGSLGNRITVMRGPLPVYIEDPVARLRVVKQAMDGLKDSKQAVGAEVLAGVQQFAPPTILAQASRLNFSTRLFNVIVTNVPGPQFPLYILGRRLVDLFPIAFLPEHHALAIAIMSYDGGIDFGLLGDYDALADLSTLAELIEESLAELVTAARACTPEPKAAPARKRQRAKKSGAGKSRSAKRTSKAQ